MRFVLFGLTLLLGACAQIQPAATSMPDEVVLNGFKLQRTDASAQMRNFYLLDASSVSVISAELWLNPVDVIAAEKALRSGAETVDLALFSSIQKPEHYVDTAVRIRCDQEPRMAWKQNAQIVKKTDVGLEKVQEVSATTYLGIPHDENIDGFTSPSLFGTKTPVGALKQMLCPQQN